MRTIFTGTLGLAALLALVAGCSTPDSSPCRELCPLVERDDPAGYAEAWHRLSGMDARSRNACIPELLRSDRPRAVYLGAAMLVRHRMYDEAAPFMVELLTSGQADEVIRGYMLSDWRVSRTVWVNMMSRVGRSLLLGMETYLPETRQRVQDFLIFSLGMEVNKPFDREYAAVLLSRLKREADRTAKGRDRETGIF